MDSFVTLTLSKSDRVEREEQDRGIKTGEKVSILFIDSNISILIPKINADTGRFMYTLVQCKPGVYTTVKETPEEINRLVSELVAKNRQEVEMMGVNIPISKQLEEVYNK